MGVTLLMSARTLCKTKSRFVSGSAVGAIVRSLAGHGLSRGFATDVGLKRLTTPACNPMRSSVANIPVKTTKPGYAALMPQRDAAIAAHNLATAFKHGNGQYP